MSIAIIGAGNVGMALGQALTRRGEQVIFGVPDTKKYAAAVAALGERARYLEPFAMTWIHLAFRQGMGRRFAFGLLRRG